MKNTGIIEIEIDEMDFGECAGEYDLLSDVNEIKLVEELDNIYFIFEIKDMRCKRLFENYRTNTIFQ